MKDLCLFLKPMPGDHGLRCAAGINFVLVGPDRALCRVCPLADLGDVQLCEYAEVYTALCKDKTGTPLIEVGVWCFKENTIAEDVACTSQCFAPW